MRRRLWVVVPVVLGALIAAAPGAHADDPPPDPPPPTAQCHRLGVVGDSLTLGSKTTLLKSLATAGITDVRFDGQVSRRIPSTARAPYSGVKALRGLRASGYQMDCYLIGLGTNDAVTKSSAATYQKWIREMLTEIGDFPVLWVNVALPRYAAAAELFNATLAGMVTEFPKLQVADWAAIMPDHTEWFTGDKVHLRTPGRIYRGEWSAQQVFDRLFTAAPVPVPASCSISRTLQWKTKHADVVCLETRLVELGYALATPDDVFDTATYRAVIDFQKSKGLTPNGVVRTQTRAALGLTPPA